MKTGTFTAFRYIGKEVRIAYCEDTVEIYLDNQRIALHSRSYKSHGHTTTKEHMPDAHQAMSKQQGWDPEYYLRKAAENGPCTYELFKKVMDSKLIIDQSYSSCLGLLRLIKAYGAVRMENACKRALTGYKFSFCWLLGCLTKIPMLFHHLSHFQLQLSQL